MIFRWQVQLGKTWGASHVNNEHSLICSEPSLPEFQALVHLCVSNNMLQLQISVFCYEKFIDTFQRILYSSYTVSRFSWPSG